MRPVRGQFFGVGRFLASAECGALGSSKPGVITQTCKPSPREQSNNRCTGSKKTRSRTPNHNSTTSLDNLIQITFSTSSSRIRPTSICFTPRIVEFEPQLGATTRSPQTATFSLYARSRFRLGAASRPLTPLRFNSVQYNALTRFARTPYLHRIQPRTSVRVWNSTDYTLELLTPKCIVPCPRPVSFLCPELH